MALPGPQPQRRIRHGLRRHTGKGAVNFIAPVHTPRRWDWLHNRMVPAVLRVRDYAPHANATHATNPIIRKLHGSLIVRVAPKANVAQGHEQHALSDCLSGWKSKAAIGVVGETANRDSISGINTLKWPHCRH